MSEKQEHANKVVRHEKMEVPARALKSLIFKELIRQVDNGFSIGNNWHENNKKLRLQKKKGRRNKL